MTALPIVGCGVGGQMLWGLGVEVALLVAAIQIALLHWLLIFHERKHRSLHDLTAYTIEAMARAMPEGIDIAASDQWVLRQMTHRHRCQFGDPRQR
jgi:hypothetical protein